MKQTHVPDAPYADSRVISTRIPPELHKQLRESAARHDCAVSAIIKTALESYIKGVAH
ncbi:Ribbon-helix-helix protein CopG domain-containing protein [Caballeronia sp. S22]